jgi:hypothetical protein
MPATVDPGAGEEAARRDRRRRIGTVLGVAITLVALGVAIAFGLDRDDDPGRLAVAVVGLHDQGPSSGPPPLPPDAGVVPGFSWYAERAGWRLTGSRRDRVEGRTVDTAFWERAGKRIAHSVISGDPVGAPADVRRTGRRGLLLRSFDRLGRTAVIWQEGEHTAVISAIGISRAALYALAGGPRLARPGR